MKKVITVLVSIMLVMALGGTALAVGTFVPLPFPGYFFPGQITANYDGTVLAGNWDGPFFYANDGGVEYIDEGGHGYISFWDISGDGSTRSVASGAYFCHLKAAEVEEMLKMMLVR